MPNSSPYQKTILPLLETIIVVLFYCIVLRTSYLEENLPSGLPKWLGGPALGCSSAGGPPPRFSVITMNAAIVFCVIYIPHLARVAISGVACCMITNMGSTAFARVVPTGKPGLGCSLGPPPGVCHKSPTTNGCSDRPRSLRSLFF